MPHRNKLWASPIVTFLGELNMTEMEQLAKYFEIPSEKLLERYPFLRNLTPYRLMGILEMFDDYYKELVEAGAFGPGA